MKFWLNNSVHTRSVTSLTVLKFS